MDQSLSSFLRDDTGAVSVDWTVLSAATVAMSLATVGVLSGGLQSLISRLDGELRAQMMSDSFVTFTSAHFEPLYETNSVSASAAEDMFLAANARMNQEVLDLLQMGIEAFEAGQLRDADIAQLYAIASVAAQRNLVSDTILDYYFGFDGASPMIRVRP
jgi:Flp pilus assembly pilin Flp